MSDRYFAEQCNLTRLKKNFSATKKSASKSGCLRSRSWLARASLANRISYCKAKNLPENGYTFKAAEIVYLLATNLLGYASVFGVITLGVDRLLAVYLHLGYQELVTRRRVVTLVIFVWMFCAIISLMRLWIDVNIMYIMFVIIEASWFVCATLLYCKIYLTARRHMKQIQMQQVQRMEKGNEVENVAVITKSSVSILFVILALLVCYLPNFFV